MTNGILKCIAISMLLISAIGFQTQAVDAQSNKVMWGKTELKLGQIGKVTIKSPTALFRLEKNNALTKVRNLKAGEEFRVYSYKNLDGYMYGVGGGNFIYNIQAVKYETPSKTKLALLSGNPYVNPVKIPNPTAPNPVTDKNTVYKEKLNTIKNTKYNNYKEYANAIFKLQEEVGKDNYNMIQPLVESYYHYGIEVDEVVLTFNDGAKLLAFERSPESYTHNIPNNRSATLYNNEYYLSVPILEYVLNAALDTYWYNENEGGNNYDGKFLIAGASSTPATEFKDISNKKLGHYNVLTLKDHFNNRALTISEKEYPFVSGGVGLSWSSTINPYSNDEIKDILDIKFDMTYDKTNNRMTFHFDKPLKEKYPN